MISGGIFMFEEEGKLKKAFWGSMIGGAATLLIWTAGLFLSALILSLLKDPSKGIFSTGICILMTGALLGGIVANRIGDSFISSVFLSLVSCVLILLLSMIPGGESTMKPMETVLSYVALFLAPLVGGMLHHVISQNTQRRPKRRKNRGGR